ncbi:MAG TPA: hypothetical protein VF194_04070 [Ferrovibrio sp.]|uniref:hypothetical protein n=1 Tax=Ferrovibrio sp. TaxID=1917215 RepID=UPI002ED1E739
MESTTKDRLQQKADIFTQYPAAAGFAGRRRALNQQERLHRWNELLRRHQERALATFFEIEYLEPELRDRTRCDNSAISVAFEDPVLRADGLTDDTYGTAKRYFGLTDRQMHRIVCYCHHGATAYAGGVAYMVRAAYHSSRPAQPGPVARLWRALMSW